MIIDVRRLITLAALTALGVVGWSMLHDAPGLEQRSSEIACRGVVCNAVLKKKTRDLFGFTFTFTTYGEQTLLVAVTCTRVLWLLGDYQCAVSGVDAAPDGRFEQKHPSGFERY